MQYLLLIYDNPAEYAANYDTPEKQQAHMAGYFQLNAELKEAGAMLGGEALEPVTTATTVRVRGGESLHTDGPFAETREHLGGFYFIDVENLDEALKWAAKIPAAQHGCVEVRPVMLIPGDK